MWCPEKGNKNKDEIKQQKQIVSNFGKLSINRRFEALYFFFTDSSTIRKPQFSTYDRTNMIENDLNIR